MNRARWCAFARSPVAGPHAWIVSTALAWLACSAGLAGDDALPRVTADNAGDHVGRPVIVEFVVHGTKFANRRGMRFLYPSANFRSRAHVPVAVPDEALARYRAAGIEDFDAAYRGQMIRARGRLVRDEGQYLVAVDSPGDIEIVADRPKSAAKTTALVVVNERGETTRLPLPLPADLARQRISIVHEGSEETFEGVPLHVLLARAGVVLGAEARGPLLARYVLVSSSDGYRALLSSVEVDPFMCDGEVLVAEGHGGEPLSGDEGPLRLVVSRDKHGRRWVNRVERIEVRAAEAEKPAGR